MDTEHEIFNLHAEVAGLKAEVTSLKDWQKKQNGTIRDVDQKVDQLKTWIMATMAGVLVSLFVNLVK